VEDQQQLPPNHQDRTTTTTTGAFGGPAGNRRRAEENELLRSADGREAKNEHAVKVINRISDKLTGRDFKATVTLPVDAQVQKLIQQATSMENLCQCFIGWCAFW
jgi:FKBP12-rapamycin complex-associated protein